MGVREALRVAVEHEVDRALRPARHRLGFVLGSLAEAEARERLAEAEAKATQLVSTAIAVRKTIPLIMIWTGLFVFTRNLATLLVDGAKMDVRFKQKSHASEEGVKVA